MSRQPGPAAYPPSVGECIDRADVLARDLLYEAPHRDGRTMLRTWGEVVEGAHDLWRLLPRRSDVPGNGQEVLDQLERSARTLRRRAGGGTDVDPILQDMAGSFTQAADLLVRNSVHAQRNRSRLSDAHLSDAFAARVKVMHSLYVAAHAVSVGLAQNELSEKFDTRTTYSVPAGELSRRLLDVEQIAYSYIQGHYPQALDARQPEPIDETRIPTAIAAWDIHAQRVLTREPTTHALARVAGAAFTASMHAHRLWRAAAQAGHVDARTFEHEIAPALETMIEKWDSAHTLFRRLTHRLDSSPKPLSDSCWALPDAMRQLNRPRQEPGHLIDRLDRSVDPAMTVRSLHRFHATAAGVASVLHETTRDAEVSVDARAANDLITERADEAGRWARPSLSAVIAPGDLLRKRAIPAPEAIRARMDEAAQEVASASRGALRSTLAVSDGRAVVVSCQPRGPELNPATRRLQYAQQRDQPNERTAAQSVHLPG